MTRMPSIRRLALGGALLLAALAGPQLAGIASAHAGICRTDPIFYLSNGMKLTISANIGTQANSVANVSYTVHVPQGTSVVRTVLTGGQFTHKETALVKTDDAAGSYDTDAVVTLYSGTAPVTATSILLNQWTGTYRAIGSASGFNGDHLDVHLVG